MKILVATNDSDKLILFNSALKKLGHSELMTVSTSHDAIHKSRVEKPDLIILDISMDENHVNEAAQQIREIYLGEWLPILFIANFETEIIKRIIFAGGDDYILNPLDETVILAKLKIMQKLHDMHLKMKKTIASSTYFQPWIR